MPFAHALLWIDHRSARVLQFNKAEVDIHKVEAHSHPTRQHGSGVRTEHEYFGAVCDQLAGIDEVLVTGPRTAQSDFRHYVDKHRPALAAQIAGWQPGEQASDAELVAMARRYFDKYDRMDGTA